MGSEDIARIENVKSWTAGVEVEPEAIQQLRNLAALPILAGHVAVMPDVHLGKGATVGSVIPTKAAIIPSGNTMYGEKTTFSGNGNGPLKIMRTQPAIQSETIIQPMPAARR